MNSEATQSQRIKKASSQRREAQKEELRAAILEAAIKLFEQKGYENFSLRQVAEAIGYTPTTIYLYFDNKDDLLFQTAMAGFRTFGQSLKEAYESSPAPYVSFVNIGRAYVEFGLEHPIHYQLMFMQRSEFLSHKPPAGCDSVIDSFGVLKTSLQACARAGLLKAGDLEVYANTAWAFVHGIVALAISIPDITKAQVYQMQAQVERSFKEGFFTR